MPLRSRYYHFHSICEKIGSDKYSQGAKVTEQIRGRARNQACLFSVLKAQPFAFSSILNFSHTKWYKEPETRVKGGQSAVIIPPLEHPLKLSMSWLPSSLNTHNPQDVCDVSFFLSLVPKCDTILSS